MNLRIAKCAFAVSAALAAISAFAQTTLPAPTSGTLFLRYVAPLADSTVSGTLSLDKCYVTGSGVTRVDFFLDSTLVSSDTNMADGMSCVLDTTKFANGTHRLSAVGSNSAGWTYNLALNINIQNAASSTTTPTSTTSTTPTSTTPTSTTPTSTTSTTPTSTTTTTTTTSTTPTTTTSTTTLPAPTAGTLAIWGGAPAAGATVSGLLTLDKCYVKGSGVTRVDFFVDSTALNSDTNMADGMSCVMDTTKFANGTHQFKAVASNGTGGTYTELRSFNIQNAVATTTTSTTTTTLPAPTAGTLAIWGGAPAAGATVSGLLTLDKCYVKGTGVTRVDFFVDSTALNSDTNMADGMSCVMDTTKFANGTHQFKAVASNGTGGTYTELRSFNIQNAAASTPPTTPPSASLPAGGTAVSTFHSTGLYWTPPSNPGAAGCTVQYRKSGGSTWSKGMNLWYDARNNECRGSLVQLTPATTYDVQIGVGSTYSVQTSATTWSEQFPIAKTITVGSQSSTLNITESGTAGGYVLYQAAPGAVIDVANAQPVGINIAANYVIVRGFTVRGGQQHGIIMQPGQHDIVIEGNDVSGWGRYNYTNSAGWQVGMDEDSGITARCYNGVPEVYRYVIQRNKVHDPRYGANSWDWGHPAGPNAISSYECGSNNVIRYNEVSSSSAQHYYMDAIGGGNNNSNKGFPGADSDIYGNIVMNAWDDAIEAEGGGKNVRVWGNYMDSTATGVASTPVAIGPIYIFRNVQNRSRQRSQLPTDQDDRNNAFKSGTWPDFGDGRRYVLHNTLLQATVAGSQFPLGPGGGISAAGSTEPLTNTVSRNNILQIWKSNWNSVGSSSGSDFNYDLSNGAVLTSGAELNGLVGTPIYASGAGWQNEAGGNYQLAPNSAGYGKALPLPNFNDAYAAPDFGAHQSGTPSMKFGVNQ